MATESLQQLREDVRQIYTAARFSKKTFKIVTTTRRGFSCCPVQLNGLRYLTTLPNQRGIQIMIFNMSNNATEEEINHVIERIKECGYQAHVIQGAERTVIGAIGSNGRRSEIEALRAAPGVEEVIEIAHPFKLVSRQLRQQRTVVDVHGVKIGGGDLVVMAGPGSGGSGEQVVGKALGL